jgi:hypothetical protein
VHVIFETNSPATLKPRHNASNVACVAAITTASPFSHLEIYVRWLMRAVFSEFGSAVTLASVLFGASRSTWSVQIPTFLNFTELQAATAVQIHLTIGQDSTWFHAAFHAYMR